MGFLQEIGNFLKRNILDKTSLDEQASHNISSLASSGRNFFTSTLPEITNNVASTGGKRLAEVFRPNPIRSQTPRGGFWNSPAASALSTAQRAVEAIPHVNRTIQENVPMLHLEDKLRPDNVIGRTATQIAELPINMFPLAFKAGANFTEGVYRGGDLLKREIKGEPRTWQEYVKTAGLLTEAPLFAEIPGVGKIIENIPTKLNQIVKGIKGGAKIGGKFGAIGTAQQIEEDTQPVEFTTNLLQNIVSGGAFGGVAGGAFGAVGGIKGVKKSIQEAKTNPEAGYIKFPGWESLSPQEYKVEVKNRLQTAFQENLSPENIKEGRKLGAWRRDNSQLNTAKQLYKEFQKDPDAFVEKYSSHPQKTTVSLSSETSQTWSEFVKQREEVLAQVGTNVVEPAVKQAVSRLNLLDHPTASSGFAGEGSKLAVANGNKPTHTIDGKLGLSDVQIEAVNRSGLGKVVKMDDFTPGFQAILVNGNKDLNVVSTKFNKIIDIIEQTKTSAETSVVAPVVEPIPEPVSAPLSDLFAKKKAEIDAKRGAYENTNATELDISALERKFQKEAKTKVSVPKTRIPEDASVVSRILDAMQASSGTKFDRARMEKALVKRFDSATPLEKQQMIDSANFDRVKISEYTKQYKIGGREAPQWMQDQKLADDTLLQTEPPIVKGQAPILAREVPVEKPVSQSKPLAEVFGEKTELQRQTELRKAELEAADKRLIELDDLLLREGFDNHPLTAEKILSGELKASQELVSRLRAESESLGQGAVEHKGLPVDKLKENYIPHVSKDTITPVNTASDGFISMIDRSTFDPTRRRNDRIKPEDMADVSSSLREGQISILKDKYYTVEQANKIMEENKLPKEKGDQVVEFVEKQREKADEVRKEHIEKTDFGKSRNYLDDAYAYEDSLAEITGSKSKRPIVDFTHAKPLVNLVDNVVSFLRGDALFFKDKTNKAIYDAFLNFRDSQNGVRSENYGAALGRFIKKLSSYEYADPIVKERVNLYIDSKLKEHKVTAGLGKQAIMKTTEVFSMAQIGGNIKTMVLQPLETLRILVDYGPEKFKHGVTNAFNPKEAKRLNFDYGLEKEVSGNIYVNPLYKEAQATLKGKVYDGFKEFLFKGLMATEGWKNTAYASALEKSGMEKGLRGQELRKFVLSELLRLAHMADTDMTPHIMKNRPVNSALLQYSQYALKNQVLKWDTVVSKDITAKQKMIKLTSFLLADMAAVAATAAITGVPVRGALGWMSNSVLPNGFGPIVTVPWQMGKEAYAYSQLSEEDRELQDSLMDKEKAIAFRNFVPVGNQMSKTGNTMKILDQGYAESKRGNINYTAGNMNPLQITQALVFGPGAIPNKKEADKKWREIDKEGIYPTLTKVQSEALKSLPKDQQEDYYNSRIQNQETRKDISNLSKKEPTFLESIFKGEKKETKPFTLSKDSKPEDIKLFNQYVDEKVNAGIEVSADEIASRYFRVNKADSEDISEKEKAFAQIKTLYDDDTKDEAFKQKVIEASGASKEDWDYYRMAKQNVRERRQELIKIVEGTSDRAAMIEKLGELRKSVAGTKVASNEDIDYLYDQEYITKDEKAFLNAIKYDEVKQSFYTDRDYKGGGDGAASAKKAAASLKKLMDIFAKSSVKKSSSKKLSSFAKPQTNANSTKIEAILKSKKKKLPDKPNIKA